MIAPHGGSKTNARMEVFIMRSDFMFDQMFRNLMDLGTIAVRHPFFKDVKNACECGPECDCGDDCSCTDVVEDQVMGILHAHAKPFEDKYVVAVEVPGLTEDNLTIEFKDDVLTIKAQYGKVEDSVMRAGLWRTAFKFKGADGTAVSAKLDSGVLTVTLPKKIESQPVKIEINK